MILTQIPAQSTFEFYIIITSTQLNPSIIMSTKGVHKGGG